METVQLRRYVLEPDRMTEFLAWFPTIVAVRQEARFRVLFALADHGHDTFTWAVALDGDEASFVAIENRYKDSPERAKAFETFPGGIASQEIGFATPAV